MADESHAGSGAGKFIEGLEAGAKNLEVAGHFFEELGKTIDGLNDTFEGFNKLMGKTGEEGRKSAESVKESYEGLSESLKQAFEMISEVAEKAFEGIRKVAEKTWDQIEKGAALNQLSKQTGESVAALFQLQQGFKAAGLGAEDVGPAMAALNASLDDLNSSGKATPEILAKAGLSAQSLGKMGGADAMTHILETMSKMGRGDAMKLGATLFGASEAGKMVELSRGMEEFRDAMKESQAEGAKFQGVAAVFESIEHALDRVKEKLDPIFLTLAEHIAPVLQKVLEWVNSIDLTPLADGIGEAFDVFAEAFSEGKVMDLLRDGFAAAVEFLGNMLFGLLGNGNFWAGIWSVMVGELQVQLGVIAKSFMNLGLVLKSAIITAFNVAFEWLGKIPGAAKTLGLENYKADTFGETFARERENAQSANQDLDKFTLGGIQKSRDGAKQIGQALGETAFNADGPQQKQFREELDALLGRAPKKTAAADKKKDQSSQPDSEEHAPGSSPSGSRPNATSIEKMGFVFGGNMASDHAATTANNTTKMVAQLGTLIGAVSGKKSGAALANSHAD